MFLLYQEQLQKQLTSSQLIILEILINILQIHKWVRLESLANRLPLPITFESRRRKLQRYLLLKSLTVEKIWWTILKEIIKKYYSVKEPVYLVIDRTRWQKINILMVSVIYHKRAIPIYFELLKKKGNSNSEEQIKIIKGILPLFKEYQKIVLGIENSVT
jgi:hypothetical protein